MQSMCMWPFGSMEPLWLTSSPLRAGGRGTEPSLSRCWWGRNQCELCVPEREFASQAPRSVGVERKGEVC